jgi:hypothetical protein
VDSTGVARITTFMRDIGTGNMVIENTLWTKINKIFSDRYEVIMTGKALVLKPRTKPQPNVTTPPKLYPSTQPIAANDYCRINGLF